MESFLSRLAQTLDGWSDAGRTTLTETDIAIVANQLVAADTRGLALMCAGSDWVIFIEDATGGEASMEQLLPDLGPFRVVLSKPNNVAGSDRLITETALSAILADGPILSSLRLVRCNEAFETATTRFCPFDDVSNFEQRIVTAKPRRVVRESSSRRIVAEDIGLWLLRDATNIPWTDHAFRVWVRHATPSILHALANEVEPEGLIFRGPPLVRLVFQTGVDNGMNENEFRALQAAATWVYDNERELEMRHGLYAAEIARAATSGSDVIAVFRSTAAPALESARIAYGLNLSQVSRDTLKALADLRKAVSDETAKLAESTRSIAGSIAAALFAGLGLLVTRSTTNTPGYLLIGLSIVLALYVTAIIWSGKTFVNVQASIRAQWRNRLYAFLSSADYLAMVEIPAQEAEKAFKLMARLGAIISLLLIIGVITFVVTSMPTTPAAPPLLIYNKTINKKSISDLLKSLTTTQNRNVPGAKPTFSPERQPSVVNHGQR